MVCPPDDRRRIGFGRGCPDRRLDLGGEVRLRRPRLPWPGSSTARWRSAVRTRASSSRFAQSRTACAASSRSPCFPGGPGHVVRRELGQPHARDARDPLQGHARRDGRDRRGHARGQQGARRPSVAGPLMTGPLTACHLAQSSSRFPPVFGLRPRARGMGFVLMGLIVPFVATPPRATTAQSRTLRSLQVPEAVQPEPGRPIGIHGADAALEGREGDRATPLRRALPAGPGPPRPRPCGPRNAAAPPAPGRAPRRARRPRARPGRWSRPAASTAPPRRWEEAASGPSHARSRPARSAWSAASRRSPDPSRASISSLINTRGRQGVEPPEPAAPAAGVGQHVGQGLEVHGVRRSAPRGPPARGGAGPRNRASRPGRGARRRPLCSCPCSSASPSCL